MRIILPLLFLIALNGFSQKVPRTEFVAINGTKTAYSSNGIQTRKPGESLLVFESGAMTPKENWDTLLNCLQKNTAWFIGGHFIAGHIGGLRWRYTIIICCYVCLAFQLQPVLPG